MKLRTVLSILLWLTVCSASATPPLRVGTDESLPPYSFVRDGKAAGIDVDMLHAAAKRLGLEVEVIPLPNRARLAEDLRTALDALHRDGTYAKIVESYLKP